MKKLLCTLFTAAVLASCGNAVSDPVSYSEDSLYLVIGSYATPEEDGIQVYGFNQSTGDASLISGLKGISNPSFVYPNQDGTRMYAVGEDEGLTSTAHFLTFDKETATLQLQNTQLTQGGAPCNIMLSPSEDYVYTANYFGGSMTEFKLAEDGSLGEGRVIAFSGTSVDPERQTKPYIHAVNFTPDKKFLLADDLGTDNVHMFPLNDRSTDASLPLLDETNASDVFIKAGMGPRHLCFAPNGKRAYLIGELSGDVATLSYENGQLQVMQTLKADSLNAGGSADVHVSPDGKYVYTSHRLKGDGISVLKVLEDGTLEKVGYQATGIHPRNFAITPNGKLLLVACRDTDEVQIFIRDAETGLLTDTGKKIQMSKPVCLQFVGIQ